MKKLLFLLGIASIICGCNEAFASKKHQTETFTQEPLTYIEVGTFANATEDNGITASYGMRKFYRSNLAFDTSIFTAFIFNGDFVLAYKCVGLFYLPPIKSTVTPYIGIGGFAGMVSYKDVHKNRCATIAGNGLMVLGAQIDIKGYRQFVAATYHLNSSAILLSVGRVF